MTTTYSNDSLRRRSTPQRDIGHYCIVARPADGEPLLLDPISALVWSRLVDWCTGADLNLFLRERYPHVSAEQRHVTLDEIVQMLVTEGLVERQT